MNHDSEYRYTAKTPGLPRAPGLHHHPLPPVPLPAPRPPAAPPARPAPPILLSRLPHRRTPGSASEQPSDPANQLDKDHPHNAAERALLGYLAGGESRAL